MSLRSRITKLEKQNRPLMPPTRVVHVDHFKPGPSAPEGAPIRILMRKPNGEERAVSGLRAYYEATALPRGWGVPQ